MAYVKLPDELAGFATRTVTGRIVGFEFSVYAGETVSCDVSPAKARRKKKRGGQARRLHLRSDRGEKRFDLRGVPSDLTRQGDMAAVIAVLPNTGDHGPIVGVANLEEDERVDFRWREDTLLKLLTGETRDYRGPRARRRMWGQTTLLAIAAGATSYLAMAAYLDPAAFETPDRLKAALIGAWTPETLSAVAVSTAAVAVIFGLMGLSRISKKARGQQRALTNFWARVGHALGYAADRREKYRPVESVRPARKSELAGPLLSPSRLLPAPGKAVSAMVQEKRLSESRASGVRVEPTMSKAAFSPRQRKQRDVIELDRREQRAQESARERAKIEARRRAEEEARIRAEEEARYRAEEEARIRAEEEARIRAEEEARIRAEEEARIRAEEEARIRAEEEARIRAEEEARIRAEEEARIRAEEEARYRAEEEARIRAEEEARIRAEEEARYRAEEEARIRAEEEARYRAEEEARIRAEEEARYRAEEEARRRALQEMRRREEEEQTHRLQEQQARRSAERARAAAALARLEARERARRREPETFGARQASDYSYDDQFRSGRDDDLTAVEPRQHAQAKHETQFERLRARRQAAQRHYHDDDYADPHPVAAEPEAPRGRSHRVRKAPSFFETGLHSEDRPGPRRPR